MAVTTEQHLNQLRLGYTQFNVSFIKKSRKIQGVHGIKVSRSQRAELTLNKKAFSRTFALGIQNRV